MDLASRVGGAIKQARIVIEKTDSSDIIEYLEKALEPLEKARDTLEIGDGN